MKEAPRQNNEQAGRSQLLMDRTYSSYWGQEKSHGPHDARVSLSKRAKPFLMRLEQADWVLDLGAGRQILERQWNSWTQKPKCNIATIDIADITQKQLLRRKSAITHHQRGDGANLPYADNSFSMSVSSMGLELMPNDAIGELARVTKPGGIIMVNVLHPSISKWKKDSFLVPDHRKMTDEKAKEFWEYYGREDNIFGKGEDVIRRVFEEFGLNIHRIETVNSGRENTSWIEIDASKDPAVSHEQKSITLRQNVPTAIREAEITAGYARLGKPEPIGSDVSNFRRLANMDAQYNPSKLAGIHDEAQKSGEAIAASAIMTTAVNMQVATTVREKKMGIAMRENSA